MFLYPLLSGERKAEQRRAAFAQAGAGWRGRSTDAQRSRREQVEGSLKEIERAPEARSKVALGTRITQAGLTWSKQKF